MKAILPPVGDLGMDRLHLPLAPLALRLGELGFEVAVEPGLLKLSPVRARRDGLKPEVDADVITPAPLRAGHLAHEVAVPPAPCVPLMPSFGGLRLLPISRGLPCALPGN